MIIVSMEVTVHGSEQLHHFIVKGGVYIAYEFQRLLSDSAGAF